MDSNGRRVSALGGGVVFPLILLRRLSDAIVQPMLELGPSNEFLEASVKRDHVGCALVWSAASSTRLHFGNVDHVALSMAEGQPYVGFDPTV